MAITTNGLEQLGFTPEVDFKLENIGQGFFIKEWNSASPQPSVAEIEAAHIEWQTAFNAQAYARNRKAEYPDIGDQLDMIYHNGDGGATFQAAIKAIKDKYPKE